MNYIEKYCDYFGYCYDEPKPSELSNKPADWIHHIILRSAGGKDNIENLIALTHKEHELAHFIGDEKKWLRANYLQEKHNNFLKNFNERKRFTSNIR